MNNIQNTYRRPTPRGWRERLIQNYGMGMSSPFDYADATLPNWMAQYSLVAFIMAFIACNFALGHGMPFQYAVFSAISVIVFFYGTKHYALSLRLATNRRIEKNIFTMALLLRLALVLFGFFYYNETIYGKIIGFGDDSGWYMDFAQGIAQWLKGDIKCSFTELMNTYRSAVDDSGYPVWLGILYLLSFESSDVFVPLVVKAFLGAYSCICMYRVARRHFGQGTAILAGLFMCFNPYTLFWSSCMLKETEMVFLCCVYLDKTDKVLSSKKVTFRGLLPGLLAALGLLFFRSALGVVAFLAVFTHIVLASGRVMSAGKKVLMGILVGLVLVVGVGDRIRTQSSMLMEQVQSGQQHANMEWRAERQGGNAFAKYAGAAVFAPLIFTLPFPTFNEANEAQIFQMEMSGGSFIKNILSYFVIMVLILLLISGEWRKHVFILAYTLGYHIVLIMSPFAQSGRFHMPVVPITLVFAAFGIQMAKRNARMRRAFTLVLVLEVIASLAWNWFKLAGRGLA